MNNEYEIIQYPKLRHINIFLNNIYYRNFHFHNGLELLCVIEGNGIIRKSNEEISVSKGSIILFNSNESHEIDATGNSITALIIQISNNFLSDYCHNLKNIHYKAADISNQLSQDNKKMIWQLICNTSLSFFESDGLFELEIISYITKILSFLIQNIPNDIDTKKDYLNRKKNTQRMNRIYSYIDQNYKYPIKLQDIAAIEGITPTHLSHFFTENFGIPFQDYVNNIRFEHAMSIINDPTLSLYEIAINSGFSDPKYMTKMFEKRLSCKPKDFRRINSIYTEKAVQNNSSILEFRYNNNDCINIVKSFKSTINNFKKTNNINKHYQI